MPPPKMLPPTSRSNGGSVAAPGESSGVADVSAMQNPPRISGRPSVSLLPPRPGNIGASSPPRTVRRPRKVLAMKTCFNTARRARMLAQERVSLPLPPLVHSDGDMLDKLHDDNDMSANDDEHADYVSVDADDIDDDNNDNDDNDDDKDYEFVAADGDDNEDKDSEDDDGRGSALLHDAASSTNAPGPVNPRVVTQIGRDVQLAIVVSDDEGESANPPRIVQSGRDVQSAIVISDDED
ncbi:hypothetical protein L227DRAFT_568427 [Lentinus tigrinus ALCF2SS1-6]|uniref:Uncharacterized protein n=1 Tax=Lentinus tigrinus ALCF2SS1-6 TaxID=1328759 RepID=A0A5C2RR81_9APHY|nr:hypothetical protein L227DRAFT_568427 [Lentinus tigrinus ALCF2SS1-6]